ncbi:hypothetical protein EVAR_80987_1 [Eumeta japonica]|uniref:Uncharacterized protein n=1 Tax=Eumeta variegata TaxID=151549 RepID=A0A4C1WSB9_EUMVA|nr:hypothetical protein EVAR_80987_1 [Eumeta japonica]
MQRPTGLLSSNDDGDAPQIRLEVDQRGGCTKRVLPSAVGCFPSSSSSFFSVGRCYPRAAVRADHPSKRLRCQNLSSIGSRTVRTAMLFSDFDPGPFRNGHFLFWARERLPRHRRPYRREGRRCLCHVIGPLKDYRTIKVHMCSMRFGSKTHTNSYIYLQK